MFSFFNHRPRPVPVPGPPGPQGPMGLQGPPGQDGADGATHVNLQYQAPVFHRVATAPEDHPVPMRAHAGDAGHDLYAVQGGVIPVGQRRAIQVGYSVELDPQTYGKLEGRSSLAVNYGLLVLGGVIDSGYTGELVVILHNAGERSWSYSAGDRVAQLVVSPVVTGGSFHVDRERGSAGFGSTGQGGGGQALHPEDGYDHLDRPLDPGGAAYFNQRGPGGWHLHGEVVTDSTGDAWYFIMEPDSEMEGRWVCAYSRHDAERYYRSGVGRTELTAKWEPYSPGTAGVVVYPAADTDRVVIQPDMVNHPPHYTAHGVFPGECWEYAQYMVYGQGAAFKYLWRAEGKDTVVSNLDKAHWYLTSGGLYGEGLEWTTLEDHGDLATLLTDAVVDAEYSGAEVTTGQLLTATAAVYVSLGAPEAALEYVQRALEWYQFPGNV